MSNDKKLLNFVKLTIVNRSKCTIDDVCVELGKTKDQVYDIIRYNPYLFRKHRSKDLEERNLVFRCDCSDSQESKDKYIYIKAKYSECDNANELTGTMINKGKLCNFGNFCNLYLKYCADNFKSSLKRNSFHQSRRQVSKFFKE